MLNTEKVEESGSGDKFGSEMERVYDVDRVRNHTDLIFFLIRPCQKKTDRFIKPQHKRESFLECNCFRARMHYG